MITNIFNLEEHARMNYWALLAMGPDHPRLTPAMVAENRSNPQFFELPHFQGSIPAAASGNPHRQVGAPSGPYKFWASQVEEGD